MRLSTPYVYVFIICFPGTEWGSLWMTCLVFIIFSFSKLEWMSECKLWISSLWWRYNVYSLMIWLLCRFFLPWNLVDTLQWYIDKLDNFNCFVNFVEPLSSGLSRNNWWGIVIYICRTILIPAWLSLTIFPNYSSLAEEIIKYLIILIFT